MTMQVRIGLILTLALAMMGLACGHYTCGVTFGNSTCAAGPPSLGGGGGSGSATAAFVFVENGSGAGSVVGLTLNTALTTPTLAATPNYTAPVTPSADAGLGMAVAQKQFLYSAFGSTNQVLGWTISSTGILTAMTPVSATLGSAGTSTFDTPRVITNPAGTLLFIADQFGSQIFVFQIGTGGALTAVTGSPFSVAPLLPGNMTTDGLGTYLYITETFSDHTGDAVAAYTIGTGASLGTLTPVAGSPFTGTSFDMWQVKGEPTGKFLIGTKGMSVPVNGSDDPNLYVFTIGSNGVLSAPVAFSTTNSPFSIAVQTNASGNLVYGFGKNDAGTAFNPAEGFTLSSAGALTAVTASNTGAGDSGQFDQNGSLLFTFGGLVDNNTIVYSLTAFDVSGGALTTPTPTNTFGGFFVATDPQ